MARATFDLGSKLKGIEKLLANPKPILKQIGAVMLSESQDAFRNQGFEGSKWPARQSPNVFGIIADFHMGRRKPPARRFQDRPALMDTGRLRGSISFRVVDARSVEVGTNLPYAAPQHFGLEVESKPDHRAGSAIGGCMAQGVRASSGPRRLDS